MTENKGGQSCFDEKLFRLKEKDNVVKHKGGSHNDIVWTFWQAI
jgi:hypothetical protein